MYDFTPEATYPLGKTPLHVRINRYIEEFQPENLRVPLHPKDWDELMDSDRHFTQTLKHIPEGTRLVPMGSPR